MTQILYVGFNTMYPISVTPTVVNKKGSVVENVFQTSYGALKVKDLIGQKFGTKVNYQMATLTSYFQHRNYGPKLFLIGLKFSTLPISVSYFFNWKLNQDLLSLNQGQVLAPSLTASCVLLLPVAICIPSTFISNEWN